MIVAQNLTTGSSAPFRHIHGTKPVNLYIEGTFDGATVLLESKSPSGTWLKTDDNDITGPGMYIIESNVADYRITINGGGVSTDITIHAVGQVA